MPLGTVGHEIGLAMMLKLDKCAESDRACAVNMAMIGEAGLNVEGGGLRGDARCGSKVAILCGKCASLGRSWATKYVDNSSMSLDNWVRKFSTDLL